MKQSIVIGISSGIAAYKILDLIKILRDKGLEVYVIMTESAIRMIKTFDFEKVSGHKVYINLFPKGFDFREVLKQKEVEHVKLADSASLIVIAPATANTIAKLAYGLADDFLTTTVLATTAPVLICPSMNVHMWGNPLVQENLNKLKKLGYYILPPDSGQLACGYEGVGRLVEPQKIAEEIYQFLYQREKLKRKKIIVTAGGTSETIDAVRTITNRASGKMGVAIAEECYLRGADVLLLKSITAVNTVKRQDTSEVTRRGSSDGGGIKRGIRSLKIETFETGMELSDLIKKDVKNYDILFHTAAVSDFIPEKINTKKLDSQRSIVLKLHPSPKILHQIKSWNSAIKLVGFKAVYKEEEKNLIQIGLQKLKDSNSDFIIVNDVGKEGIGFGAEENEVYVIGKEGFLAKIEKSPKKEVARKILEIVI